MLIILGKSGSGKTSVVKELEKYGYSQLITDTTRPIRPGEIDGKDYNFRTQKGFDKLKKEGYYAETISYNTVFGCYSYGSKKDYYLNSHNNVIILNPYGYEQVSKLRNKNFTSIYLKVDDDILLKRLSKRGDAKEEIYRRLETDRKDFYKLEEKVNITININNDDSVEKIAKEIKKRLN